MDKIKILPVFRILAVVVALSILLGVFSVILSFTASAESTNDISQSTDYDKDIAVGTLKKYSCLKLSYSSEIDYLRLRNLYIQAGSPYMIYSLFGVDSLGKLIHLTSNYGEVYRYNDYTGFQFASIPDSYYAGKSYKFKLGFSVSPADSSNMLFNMFQANYDSDSFSQYVTYASIVKSSYSNFYLVYTGLPDKDSATFNSFITDVSSNISSSDFSDSSDTSPKAAFMTCASFTREDGSLPLWFKDFTADGLQYPMFSYYISDNGNHHRYQVRLSYSSSQSQVVNTIFGNVNENNISEQAKIMRDLANFLKGNLPVGSTNYTKFMALKPYMAMILKNPDTISFDESFTLNSNQMNFDMSETSGNKVYSLCLSDYSDIIANYIYRAQIVDMQTSEILDTTYFCSNKTYHKGNSGTGVKIYDYGDDYSGMIEDIKNNSPSVTPGIDNKFSTTGDIINMQDNDYLSSLKIDNIFSVLGQSAKSIGAFFQACFNIVPPSILSILLSTMSLLIVLRVLGR